jgi:hypothetical protein
VEFPLAFQRVSSYKRVNGWSGNSGQREGKFMGSATRAFELASPSGKIWESFRNPLRRIRPLATVAITLALGCSQAWAQSYYSLQHTNWPPFPFLPLEVPVLDLGDGIFAYDDLSVDYDQLRAARQQTLMEGENEPPPPPGEGGGEGNGDVQVPLAYDFTTNDLWVEIVLVTNRDISLIIHAPDTNAYDLYRTFELIGKHATNSAWRWVGQGTNGQSLTFYNVRCRHAFYMLGSGVDSDSDGLADAFEVLSSRTSPATNHTYSAELTDLEWWLQSNILVNDPEQDCGNEQNSQFETTVVVVGSTVVVAWVDSNQGVYALGENGDLANYTPRLVGFAVSRDGGVTFEDRYLPPLCTNNPTISSDDGDAGDPVLAVDRASGVICLAGTSMRSPTGYKGIPLWKSTDGGITFNPPTTVRADITQSDKPWIAVDDWPGTGQHDVYLGCIGFVGGTASTNKALWLTASTDGYGTNWSSPKAIRQYGVDNVEGIQSLIPLVGPDHTAYAFWFERTTYGTNWFKMRQVLNRGATLGDVHTVCALVTTNEPNGNLKLKRSNTAASDDTFRAFPLPVSAVNAAKTNHLYVAYADKGTNANDKADVFFTLSANGGTNWTSAVRVNTDTTTNDQWMPVLAVKPDGTQLFMAWYDRRNDTNNSLIEVYGRWGTIATNGDVSLGTEFKISTTNFPPVFAGTLTSNTNHGYYDPVYPPNVVNLHWHYDDWPEPQPYPLDFLYKTDDSYKDHVGEYNGAWAREQYVYITWTDYRLPSVGTLYGRNQSDIRFVRLTWPQ